jgi:hypothetical protein
MPPVSAADHWDVDGKAQLRENAETLEQGLSRRRGSLQALDGEDRARRAEAIEGLARYVELLRSAGDEEGRRAARYWFKLVFPDGRWTVAEKQLPAEPHLGDVLAFGDGAPWRVSDSQLVWPRPNRQPRREVFVCAPAA